MSTLVSTATMVQRLEGLLGTKDLNDWEQGFVESLSLLREEGRLTQMSSAQVNKLDELHTKHFG